MMRQMMGGKIHRATVTHADLHYVGSLTVDIDLLEAANILPNERVTVVDVTNGARLDTYIIEGRRDSGVVGINGAAAHHIHVGDLVIIMSFVSVELSQETYDPRVVHVDSDNKIVQIGDDPAVAAPGLNAREGVIHTPPNAVLRKRL